MDTDGKDDDMDSTEVDAVLETREDLEIALARVNCVIRRFPNDGRLTRVGEELEQCANSAEAVYLDALIRLEGGRVGVA